MSSKPAWWGPVGISAGGKRARRRRAIHLHERGHCLRKQTGIRIQVQACTLFDEFDSDVQAGLHRALILFHTSFIVMTMIIASIVSLLIATTTIGTVSHALMSRKHEHQVSGRFCKDCLTHSFSYLGACFHGLL